MRGIHVGTAQKYMTVVVSNICPTGGGNKAGRSPLTGNSCVERHVHSCKMIWERIENFHGLFFFLSERRIPSAYRQQLFSHEAEGRGCIWEKEEVSGRSGDDDCICIFTELESLDLDRFKVIPKAKENVSRRKVSQ